MNILKQRLKRGNVCIGAWLTVPCGQTADAMASCGFDWLAVDFEHGGFDVGSAQSAFVAANQYQVPALVRLPNADAYLARRLLDAGAEGLIIPVVENASDFETFVSHCLYPPNGKRGVGLSRCNRWGDAFDSYYKTFVPTLIPQIETATGVKNAAEIAALPYVDAVFLGPYDLSASLGCGGDFTTAVYQEHIDMVKNAAKQMGKPLGIHQVAPDRAELDDKIKQGFTFIAYATDMIAMRHALKSFRI